MYGEAVTYVTCDIRCIRKGNNRFVGKIPRKFSSNIEYNRKFTR